jgi:hypothetical protein
VSHKKLDNFYENATKVLESFKDKGVLTGVLTKV